jgi:hypothetical protein
VGIKDLYEFLQSGIISISDFRNRERGTEAECQADSREADGAPITGFVPEEVAALVTLAQKCATAIDWHRNSPLLQHVSFDEVIFMEDPVRRDTLQGSDGPLGSPQNALTDISRYRKSVLSRFPVFRVKLPGVKCA